MKQAAARSPLTTLQRIAPNRRVVAAFEIIARAVDRREAFARTKAFYRSGGGAWARALS
jgi:hypothetical protein